MATRKIQSPQKKKLFLPIILGIIGIGAIGVTTYVLTGNSLYELNPFAYVAGFSTPLSSMKKVTLASSDASNSVNFLPVDSLYPVSIVPQFPRSYWMFTNCWGNGCSSPQNKSLYGQTFKFDDVYTLPNDSSFIINNGHPIIDFENDYSIRKVGTTNYAFNFQFISFSTILQPNELPSGMNDCTKSQLHTVFNAHYASDDSFDRFRLDHGQSENILLAYPKSSNTYFVSEPFCYIPVPPSKAQWSAIMDYRVDSKYPPALNHGEQTGNMIIMTISHGDTNGVYNLENVYLTDNPDASSYFDQKYCRTTTSGTLDKLHCTKQPFNKYWHPLQYTWSGTINGKNVTRVFSVMGFAQFVIRPFTFTYNATTPTKSVLTGGMYQYRWWEDIANYRSNDKGAWKWDQDTYNDAQQTATTDPSSATTWIIENLLQK